MKVLLGLTAERPRHADNNHNTAQQPQHQSAQRSARTGGDRASAFVVGDSPLDDVVVARRVAEAEVEELAAIHVCRPALRFVRIVQP